MSYKFNLALYSELRKKFYSPQNKQNNEEFFQDPNFLELLSLETSVEIQMSLELNLSKWLRSMPKKLKQF